MLSYLQAAQLQDPLIIHRERSSVPPVHRAIFTETVKEGLLVDTTLRSRSLQPIRVVSYCVVALLNLQGWDKKPYAKVSLSPLPASPASMQT